MNWKKLNILILIVLMIITAGCSSSPQYNEVYFAGYPEADDGTLQLEGSVSVGKGAVPHQNFSNVRLVLYDENKDALTSIAVGNLSTNAEYGSDSVPLNFTYNEVPKYVVIHSPDFWDDGPDLVVEGYRFENGTYEVYGRTTPNQKFGRNET